MIKSEFLIWNGNVIAVKNFELLTTNRAFRYGDGLFESIRVSNGFPLFYRAHYSRMVRGLDALGIFIPEEFSLSLFRKKLLELIEKTGKTNGYLRAQAYRSGEGTYLPLENGFNWVVDFFPSNDLNFFELNDNEYRIDVFNDIKKQANRLSFFKSCNANVYVQAALFAQKMNFDNVIINNTENKPIETIAENLFLYNNGKVITVPIEHGPVEGIMRNTIKKIIIWNKIDFEERVLSIEDILSAEEIFLTNTQKGIISVTQFKEKSYPKKFTIGLHAKLNERVASILANTQKH